MRLFKILCFSFLLLSVKSFSQNNKVIITVDGLAKSFVYITSVNGHQQRVIDTVYLNEFGTGSFSLSQKYSSGMFRINSKESIRTSNKSQSPFSVSFLISPSNKNEIINLHTSIANPMDSILVLESNENKLYCDYLKRKKTYNQKLQLLSTFITLYPKNNGTKDRFFIDLKRIQQTSK